jgi:hypothetical protein
VVGYFSTGIFKTWKASRARVALRGGRGGPEARRNSQPAESESQVDGPSCSEPEDSAASLAPRRSGSHKTRLSSSDIGLIRSLCLVFVLLVLGYMPGGTAVALVAWVYVPSDVFTIVILLAFINQSINWIIYDALNRNFRDGYRRLLQACCCCDLQRCKDRLSRRPNAAGTMALARANK